MVSRAFITVGIGAAVAGSAYLAYKFLCQDEGETIGNDKEESRSKRILVLGLDNSGKSTIIHGLSAKKKGETFVSKPTEGFNIVCIEDSMNFWEVGGSPKYRTYWPKFLDNAHDLALLIYVIDSADSSRMSESSDALQMVLAHENMKNVPLLLCANKQDLQHSKPFDYIIKEFGLLNEDRKVTGVDTAVPRDSDKQVGIDDLKERINCFL
ncbi:DgyrCDS5801 [Dimorphilus gyrociliatus]|uniref:DgyrCDS5801 n=1 Tax=Dimorphilus gyrociliatus TaxID=2664684 RepID=A0A7I8VL01_9ANNE|nr:DgyrCDS5801 [Dimorphilus gyrociliatus]